MLRTLSNLIQVPRDSTNMVKRRETGRALFASFKCSGVLPSRCRLKIQFPLKVKQRLRENKRRVASHVAPSNRGMQPELQRDGTAWNPVGVFHRGTQCKYAIIVLNCPIYWKHSVLLRIWQNAQITVTVDGGTHRWLNYLEKQGIDLLSGEHRQYVPNLITGDLDSCSHAILDKLKNMGSIVIETPDQSDTDYTKAMLQVRHHAKAKSMELDEIYVLAETSGRFDHIIGNINTLYKCDKLVGDIKVIQFAHNSLTWILRPGLHKIHIPETLVKQQSWCGLLPFGCPASRVTTTGLKWNLNNGTMQFGGMVSTSNTYSDSEVTVDTDTPVIWTMGIEPLKEMNNGIS